MTETTIKDKKEHAKQTEMEEHMSLRNYMRDLILGANDGLVSVFSMVIGVAASGFLPREVLLAGIAAAVAGALSMAIGEYLSTKSQEEVYDAEKAIEKRHIEYHKDHEIEELYEFYEAKGFHGELLDKVVETIASNDEVLLNEMMMAEFGILEEERRSPWTATIIVGLAFFVGSLLPVVPFLWVSSTTSGMIFSTVFSVFGLFIVGYIKSILTRGHRIKAGLENMMFGLVGAAITYVIGYFVGVSV